MSPDYGPGDLIGRPTHREDPRLPEPEEIQMDLKLGDATVTVVAEWIDKQAVISGCWIGDKWVDEIYISHWMRQEWARQSERSA